MVAGLVAAGAGGAGGCVCLALCRRLGRLQAARIAPLCCHRQPLRHHPTQRQQTGVRLPRYHRRALLSLITSTCGAGYLLATAPQLQPGNELIIESCNRLHRRTRFRDTGHVGEIKGWLTSFNLTASPEERCTAAPRTKTEPTTPVACTAS